MCFIFFQILNDIVLEILVTLEIILSLDPQYLNFCQSFMMIFAHLTRKIHI